MNTAHPVGAALSRGLPLPGDGRAALATLLGAFESVAASNGIDELALQAGLTSVLEVSDG